MAPDLLINLALSLLLTVVCTTAARAAGQGWVLIFHALATELHLGFRLSWCRPSLLYCCVWTMLTWQSCSSTAAPVANVPPDKRWVTGMNDLTGGAASFQNVVFVLAGSSAACASCTSNINTPSDSISFFYLNKCRYLWLWLSNHMAETVLSVLSPSPCWFFNPHWTMPLSLPSALQDALLLGATAALM